jgi:hypothetical protein
MVGGDLLFLLRGCLGAVVDRRAKRGIRNSLVRLGVGT